MKRNNKITKVKQLSMILLGLVSAILLLVQQPLNQMIHAENKVAIVDNGQDNNHQPEEKTYQVVTYEVLVPIMSINLFHSFDLLIELPSLENTGSELIENTIKVFDSFIQNLFNRIIAPNAP